MNILPKKRWHVRTKQNIERVRKDEAQAAEEEKELQRRIRLAEQEARTDLLRKKAKCSTTEPKSEPKKEYEITQNGHINFFQELEESGVYQGETNKEHEAEEKARKEKFEKDIGLLTYLGQSSSEAKGEVPWYLKAETKYKITKSDDEEDDTVSIKQKTRLDPLNEMKKYLALKEKKSGKMFNHNKEQVHSKKHCKKAKCDKNLSKVEELRAKRLKREAEEKRRSQQFLENYRKGTSANEDVIMDDRLRQYNSQFNPHLARNNLASAKYYNVK